MMGPFVTEIRVTGCRRYIIFTDGMVLKMLSVEKKKCVECGKKKKARREMMVRAFGFGAMECEEGGFSFCVWVVYEEWCGRNGGGKKVDGVDGR
jgi:hypothetical protein